jgi:hypothetical protein
LVSKEGADEPEPPGGWWGCQCAVGYWDGKWVDCQPRTGDDVQQRDLERVEGQIKKLETGTMVTISISRKSRTGVAAGRCGRVG